jgi:hypothetical protein
MIFSKLKVLPVKYLKEKDKNKKRKAAHFKQKLQLKTHNSNSKLNNSNSSLKTHLSKLKNPRKARAFSVPGTGIEPVLPSLEIGF